MTKSTLLAKYPSEVVEAIKWIKTHNRKGLKKYRIKMEKEGFGNCCYPTRLMGGIPELFKNDNYRCNNSWERALLELGVNIKNPSRHHELRKYL